MMKPKVILLNGPSSAGKSTIAKELQKLLNGIGVGASVVALDDHLKMSKDEPIWEDDVFEVTPEMCRRIEATLSRGESVIIDHVITSERIFELIADTAGQNLKKVLVKCDEQILRRRESERGNRAPGSAMSSLEYLYPKTGYDLTIDTGHRSAEHNAKTIMDCFFGMETERLIIDPLRETDGEDYFHCISHDKKVLETFVCRYAESLDEFDFSKYLTAKNMFAVRLKENEKLIGIILYFDDTEDSCEIGYGIGSGHWNKGYMTEAVKRFLDYCLYEVGFKTVYASYFTGNDASRRVMEKCGMSFYCFKEKDLTYLDVERDLTYYRISREKLSDYEY